MNTPLDASDERINQLFELAVRITKEHAAALRDDPTLAAHLDANPWEIVAYADKLVERATQKGLTVTFAPYIPQWWLKRLFDESGLVLRNSLRDGSFVAEMTPEVYATLHAETVASIESDASRQLMLDAGVEP
jgi:hypothetical protein